MGLALQQALVQSKDHGVLVGLFDLHIDVGIIQTLGAGLPGPGTGADRLAAAHDTAAAAGHDLHEVIADLAALDTLDELVGIAQTVDHCGADLLAHVVKGQFLQAVIAPDAAGADAIHFHPAVAGLKAAEHRLRHAAGDAKDNAAAGTDAKGHIGGLAVDILKADTGLADHGGHLGGGQHIVHVLSAIGHGLRAEDLLLLGGAGHDGHRHQLLALIDLRIAVVFPDHRAEHLLGRAAGGNIVRQFRIPGLAELDPGRAAGGEQGALGAAGDPLQQLLRLLDHGEVRAVGSVIDLMEAQTVQGIDQLAHDVFALGDAELVAQRHTDRRSHLRHHNGVGVRQRVPDLIDVGLDADGAGGTHHPALAAVDAVGLSDGLVEGRGHQRAGAAVGKVDGVHGLDIVAHADAVAAEDALIGVANDGGRAFVDGVPGLPVLEPDPVHAHAVSQLQQMTLAAFHAGGAVPVMGRQQQLQDRPAVAHEPRGIGVDHHAIPRRLRAGGKGLAPVILHGAQAAGTVNGQFGMVTKGRYIDLRIADHGQNIGLIGKFHPLTVNGHKSHSSILLTSLR